MHPLFLTLPIVVPPSAPHCQIQGSQDIGSDVILLCSSEEGIPRPTYLWEKLDNTLKLPPTATQDQIQGTVTIRNISALSSGLYQCVASNAIGTSTCLLDLQVISQRMIFHLNVLLLPKHFTPRYPPQRTTH